MYKLKPATLVLMLLLGLQLAFANRCARKADGTRLSLSADCSKYLKCQGGLMVGIGQCPSGLHFNRLLGECDLPRRAGCSSFSIFAADNESICDCDCCASECPVIEETTTTEETITTDCDTDAPTTPSGVTDDVTANTKPPPSDDGPVPSPSEETPVSPTSAPTAATSESTTSSGSSSTSASEVPSYCTSSLTDCVNQKDNTVLMIVGDCGKFITCSAGCAIIQECPSGLYYDLNTNQCDYPWIVDCEPATGDAGSSEHAGPSGTTCNDQGVCARQKDGTMFADPDTNGYFVCQCQCPIAMPCDANTKFNETAKVCDWDRSSGSDTNNVICPDGLVYNATSDQCDYPLDYVPQVSCNSTSTICQGQPEGTLFPMEGVCNKFYKCNYNCAVEQLCPNNLIYDQKYQLCNYPQNVNCEWPYTPPSGPDAGPSGISCESNGRCLGQREGTLLPSLSSCGGYVVCQCECEIEMECDESLYWDQDKQTCNYAYNVECNL